MHSIFVRNVHQALPEACHQLGVHGYQRMSRNGAVRVFPMPVTTLYQRPTERVLFWEERDANPFFHFMESLWMLAGRDDVAFVEHYASNMGNFSDDGKTFNGAYGFRWRQRFGFDQLQLIAANLARNPDCRRQVLAMWDGFRDLTVESKDIPCNTHAYFQRGPEGELHMMVCNRSNDLVWGAYGANAVHFSVLQEVMAYMVGCPVGSYWQTSMNTHVYDRHFELCSGLADKAAMPPGTRTCPYSDGKVEPHPVIQINPSQWFRDLDNFMNGGTLSFRDPFFESVAAPMRQAWEAHKARDYGQAINIASSIQASDWRVACVQWLHRRQQRWTSKNA